MRRLRDVSVTSHTLTTPTLAVVKLIAEKEGVSPLDLRPSLHEAVNTEALNRVIESLDSDGLVQFRYKDYWVTVYSNKDVDINEREDL